MTTNTEYDHTDNVKVRYFVIVFSGEYYICFIVELVADI